MECSFWPGFCDADVFGSCRETWFWDSILSHQLVYFSLKILQRIPYRQIN